MKAESLAVCLALAIATGAANAQETPPPDTSPTPPPQEIAAPPPDTPPTPPPQAVAAAPARPSQQLVSASVQLDGAYGVRSLERLPVKGADFGAALGVQPARTFAIYAATRFFIGSTEAGLQVKSGRIGCELTWVPFERLRLFVEPGFFAAWVSRVTFAQTIVSGGVSLGAGARFDALRADAFALFLRVAVDAGPTFADGSLFAGAMFGAGVDFDFTHGERRAANQRHLP